MSPKDVDPDRIVFKKSWVLAAVLAVLLVLAAAIPARSQEGRPPQAPVSVDAVVKSRISYQGVLREGGLPVTGNRNLIFRLYSDQGCTTQVGSDIAASAVPVNNGLFSVTLDVDRTVFNGQGLWLAVQTGGVVIGCREIVPAPYALSLRPGATIQGDMSSWDGVHVVNTAATGASYGVYGSSASINGRGVVGVASSATGYTFGVYGTNSAPTGAGVYGEAASLDGAVYGVHGKVNSPLGAGVYGEGATVGVHGKISSSGGVGLYGESTSATGITTGVYGVSASSSGFGLSGLASAASGAAYGVYGKSASAEGAGVYAMGLDSGADVILAGNTASTAGDDGVLQSDPAFASSDLIFVTNDGIRIELDKDGDGEDADIEVRNKDNTLIFNVDESGTVTMGGSGIAAFPRPAYDSGWVAVAQGACETLAHNLGGNADNYVVDLEFKKGTNIHNTHYGYDSSYDPISALSYLSGGVWHNLDNTSIQLCRGATDTNLDSMRVRIWMYP